jgi:hypothetical protein
MAWYGKERYDMERKAKEWHGKGRHRMTWKGKA